MSAALVQRWVRRMEVGRSAQQIIAAAELPDPIEWLIVHIVRKVRLWRRERVAVATELVAHFRDGLEAGRTADDLLATFGNRELAIKLIRRAKKRNRPLWWRTSRRTIQGIALFVSLWMVVALGLAMRRPQVKVDYLAEFNSRLPQAPPNQQAWPIYRAALLADPIAGVVDDVQMKIDENGTLSQHGIKVSQRGIYDIRPGDADWPRAISVLEKHRPLLQASQDGGLKPVLGLKALPFDEYAEEDRKALGNNFVPPGIVNTPLNRAAWVDTPLGWMACLVSTDGWRAAAQGDASRMLQDHAAMLGLARQGGERPGGIGLQFTVSVCQEANEMLGGIEHAYPHLLDNQRIPLLHRMAAAENGLFKVDFSDVRARALDDIQRTYSDNGHGNGTLIYAGTWWLDAGTMPPGLEERRPSVLRALRVAVLPAAALALASRRQATERIQLFFDTADRDIQRPMWQRLNHQTEAERLAFGWRDARDHLRYFIANNALFATWRIVLRSDISRALHEATMAALALDVWRERHGSYPATLAELVPQYLPLAPVDYSTGNPLRYMLKNGQPLLYGLGKNGIDEGGVYVPHESNWPDPPDHGDWILYPPIAPQAQ